MTIDIVVYVLKIDKHQFQIYKVERLKCGLYECICNPLSKSTLNSGAARSAIS